MNHPEGMERKQTYRFDSQIERQTNILHMVRRLAGRVGYEGLKMRELAQLASVSPKTLYNLFNSKDELLIAALQDLIGIIRRSVDEHSHLSGIDYILNVRRSGSQAIARSPGFANVIVNLFFRSKPHDPIVELFDGRQTDTIQHLQLEQSLGGILPEIDIENLALHLYAQSWSVLMAWDKGRIGLGDIVPAQQFSYLTTLMSVSTESRRRKLRAQLSALNYRPYPDHRTRIPTEPANGDSPPAEERVRYRSERQSQRRIDILNSVRAAITDVGYHGMTVRGVAKAANVSPKTLYNIYGSKDELLLSAVIDLVMNVDDSPPPADTPALERLILRRDAEAREIRRNPRYTQAITEALLLAKPDDRLVEVLLADSTRKMESEILDASFGVADYLDPRAVAQMLVHQSWGILILWCKGLVDLDQAIAERARSLQLSLSGITTGKTRQTLADQLIDARQPSVPRVVHQD